MSKKFIITAAVALAALNQLSAAVFVTNAGSVTASGGSGENLAIAFNLAGNTQIGQLGVYAPTGLSDTLTVHLWTTGNDGYNSSLPELASVVISSGIPDVNGYIYAPISSLTLNSAQTYALSVSGYQVNSIGSSGAGDSTPSYAGLKFDFGFNFQVDVSWDGAGNPFHGAAQSNVSGIGAGTRNIASFASPVPEPETYAMLAGLGLVGFGLYRRCRQ